MRKPFYNPLAASIVGAPMTRDEERVFDGFRGKFIEMFGIESFDALVNQIEAIHPRQGYREFVRALCHWTYPPEDAQIALAMAKLSFLRGLARSRPAPPVSPGRASDPISERVALIVASWPVLA